MPLLDNFVIHSASLRLHTCHPCVAHDLENYESMSIMMQTVVNCKEEQEEESRTLRVQSLSAMMMLDIYIEVHVTYVCIFYLFGCIQMTHLSNIQLLYLHLSPFPYFTKIVHEVLCQACNENGNIP